MATTTNSAPRPIISPFLELPTELHLEILKNLEVNTDNKPSNEDFALPCLRLVNRYFYYLVPAPNYASLLRLEKTPFTVNKLLTCKLCVRLRHLIHFSYYEPFALPGTRKRICKDCGFADRDAGEGFNQRFLVQIPNLPDICWLWCRHCAHWKEVPEANARCWKACVECTDKSGGCRCVTNCLMKNRWGIGV